MKNYFRTISILTLNLVVYIVFALSFSKIFNITFVLASGISKLITFFLIVIPVVYHYGRFLKVSKISIIRLLLYIIAVLFFVLVPIILYQGENLQFHFLEKLTQDNFLPNFLIAVTIVPISEELMFKSYALEYLDEKNKNMMWIVIITSIIFGLFHLPGIYNVVYSTIFSILLCMVYLRERNIIYPIILHSFYNLLVLII